MTRAGQVDFTTKSLMFAQYTHEKNVLNVIVVYFFWLSNYCSHS